MEPVAMRVVILQQDIAWADPAENVRQAEAAIDRRPGADLYVLPEMFATGFATHPEGVAEPADSETLRWMVRKAAACRAAVVGSLAVEDGGRYYNRLCFVHPDGRVETYDKRHLFTYSGEHRHYTRGTRRVVVTFRGVRILLQVCYDLRFPVWSRNRGDYDVALYVASWPVGRIEAWSALLRARAIENQCYVVGVNRVGRDPVAEYSGASVVIDPYGRTVATCEDHHVSAAEAVLDLERLAGFRQKFPVLEDGDAFELQ